MNRIEKIYRRLMSVYGPQGWWPLCRYKGQNPTKTGSVKGYHPCCYDFPRNRTELFEICVGAILTQNTSWPQVEKALISLHALGAVAPKKLLSLPEAKLKVAIRSAGYFNVKAKKLKNFAEFFLSLRGRVPSREELLDVWGIGPETADSMLLYAWRVPTFVVDAYTRRIFSHLEMIGPRASYDDIKRIFEEVLAPDLVIFQEYHALIVEHAKRFYSKRPYGSGCFLIKEFGKVGQ
jgi:endonuclease-3 related protein